jgi:hypothetical protein
VAALGIMLSGCVALPTPPVESPRLNSIDAAVLRAAIEAVMLPRVVDATAPPRNRVPLVARTVPITLWRELPSPMLNLPSLPPIPLPQRPRLPPPPSQQRLPADLLSDAERTAWTVRNRISRDIPELGGGIFTGRGNRESVPRMAVSAPSYSSDRAAVLYAEFVCGGACGEGFLVRLRREHGRWTVWRVNALWIS